MSKKILIFDFDGTFYSGDNVFKKLPKFIYRHKREFFPNLTQEQYDMLVKENPFWKDIYVGAEIVAAMYKFIDIYPDWNISVKDFWNWQNTTLEPIEIDKNQIVDINYIKKLCNNFNVYLVSNSSPFHIKYYLNIIGLDYKIFKKIISNRFTKKDKTKKHYYKKILIKESCLPQNVYVFGDSFENDLLPAQKLGMQTFLVTDATKLKDIVKQVLKKKVTMKNITLVPHCKKDILRRYFNDYFVELAQMDYDIKFDKNGIPIYKWFDNYFFDYGRYAFFLYVDDCVAGFAMIRVLYQDTYEMAEFYVLPEYRCDGNALWFANQVINLFDGDFALSAKLCNIRAIKFWSKVAKEYNCDNFIDKDGWREWIIKNKKANKNALKNNINNDEKIKLIEKNIENTQNNSKNNSKLNKNSNILIKNDNPKNHELNLKAIYFDLTKRGEKTLEGRLNSPRIKEFKIGDYIIFFKEPKRKETLKAIILDKYIFKDFDEMANSLDKAALGFANVSKQEMVKVYRKIYDRQRETKHGVCILKIKVI